MSMSKLLNVKSICNKLKPVCPAAQASKTCCLYKNELKRGNLPWSSSSLAVVRCPSDAATISAVRPCWSTTFTSTPWVSSNLTTCKGRWAKSNKQRGKKKKLLGGPERWNRPASGPSWRRWRADSRRACCLAWQRRPDPAAACRRPAGRSLLQPSELKQRGACYNYCMDFHHPFIRSIFIL